MLKLLLRLWWLQQRRNFHWKDAVVGGYIIFIYVVFGVSFYYGFTSEGGRLFEDGIPKTFAIGLVVGLLLPDIFMKMVMKRDSTAMDDYVKARPLSEKAWNRLLLLTNLASFWNYVLPVLMLPALFWLLEFSQAVVAFLMILAFSMIDGIFVTCFRKSAEWMLRWPLILGWVGMFFVLLGYLVLFSWMPGWLLNMGMFVLASAVMAGLVVYLYHLKIYNEPKRKSSRFHSFGRVNLLSLQYIGLMRAKRVRTMVLVIAIIFFFDAYLAAFASTEAHPQTLSIVIYVVGAVQLPSLVLSQWTLGIEANFFQGLMTKPIKVSQILVACFRFYVAVSLVAAILAVPFVFITDEITVLTLLSAFGMATFVTLWNMPTCLFSSRLEIFNTSMFSLQGANMKINLYGIVCLVPIAMLVVVYWLCGAMAWSVLSILLGFFSLAVHRPVIGKLAAIFEARRYQRMEKFSE